MSNEPLVHVLVQAKEGRLEIKIHGVFFFFSDADANRAALTKTILKEGEYLTILTAPYFHG